MCSNSQRTGCVPESGAWGIWVNFLKLALQEEITHQTIDNLTQNASFKALRNVAGPLSIYLFYLFIRKSHWGRKYDVTGNPVNTSYLTLLTKIKLKPNSREWGQETKWPDIHTGNDFQLKIISHAVNRGNIQHDLKGGNADSWHFFYCRNVCSYTSPLLIRLDVQASLLSFYLTKSRQFITVRYHDISALMKP